MLIAALTVTALQFLSQFASVGGDAPALLLGLAEQRQEVALDVLDIPLDAAFVFRTRGRQGEIRNP